LRKLEGKDQLEEKNRIHRCNSSPACTWSHHWEETQDKKPPSYHPGIFCNLNGIRQTCSHHHAQRQPFLGHWASCQKNGMTVHILTFRIKHPSSLS
jgi:hypothetical protein